MVTKRGTRSRRTTSRTRPGTRRTRTTASSRRRAPKASTTLGSAAALGLVALFTAASWPVRAGLVAVALLAAAGYLVVRARRGAATDPDPEPPSPAAADPEDPES